MGLGDIFVFIFSDWSLFAEVIFVYKIVQLGYAASRNGHRNDEYGGPEPQ